MSIIPSDFCFRFFVLSESLWLSWFVGDKASMKLMYVDIERKLKCVRVEEKDFEPQRHEGHRERLTIGDDYERGR